MEAPVTDQRYPGEDLVEAHRKRYEMIGRLRPIGRAVCIAAGVALTVSILGHTGNAPEAVRSMHEYGTGSPIAPAFPNHQPHTSLAPTPGFDESPTGPGWLWPAGYDYLIGAVMLGSFIGTRVLSVIHRRGADDGTNLRPHGMPVQRIYDRPYPADREVVWGRDARVAAKTRIGRHLGFMARVTHKSRVAQRYQPEVHRMQASGDRRYRRTAA
ncbi:MAG TPA: hypothetical protein VGS28_02330 [Candidatus Saccharimonadales bacterium]|nr:hypothetical protein [Candidatus Saccharimonadales bacterium]